LLLITTENKNLQRSTVQLH